MDGSNQDNLKDVLTVLSAFLGIAGLIFGLLQYYKAQKWKKSEFAAGLLEQLSSNPDLALCCIFLDWETRRVPVPEKYQIFIKQPPQCSFVHSWATLTEALKFEDEKADFDFPLVLYRDAFDQFFTYLDRINHYLNIGLFDVSDVRLLEYWVEQIKNPRYAIVDDSNKRINPFSKFIEKYGYVSVRELMLKFALETPLSDVAAVKFSAAEKNRLEIVGEKP